ncbi:MAG: hypothetical protein WAK86_13545 [Pseudonocardiaceae bacterium]
MSEESVRQPGAIGAPSQDGGHREHAELAKSLQDALNVRNGLCAALDDLVRQAATALRPGTGTHVVHSTEPCTKPDCTIQREHGHYCPRCGPGTYDIIADLDS